MKEIRSLFTKAAEVEKCNNELLKLTDGYTLDYKPIVYAYHAAAEMTMANHTYWPISKLNYFNSGKDKLEKAVRSYPNLLEIRYIRYAIQKGSPGFLDYQSNLEEDRKMILENLKNEDWSPSFKSQVLNFVE